PMSLKLERNVFHGLAIVACFCLSALPAFASSHVLLKPDIRRAHREELVTRLRVITGLTNLDFASDGALSFDLNQTSAGSASARELLSQAVQGANVIVLEDASSRADVAFCRVVRGRYKQAEPNRPPAYVVLIDFTDFQQ